MFVKEKKRIPKRNLNPSFEGKKKRTMQAASVSPSPSDSAGGSEVVPSDYFYHIHRVLNAHIHAGNCVAAMALLSVPAVHMDARFWASPSLNVSLLASAIINHSIMVTPSSAETQMDDGGRVLDNLTPADLLILLRRVGHDGSIVSRVTQQLEAVRERSMQRARSLTVPLGTQASSHSPAPLQEERIDLAELAAVLASSTSSEEREQQRGTTALHIVVNAAHAETRDELRQLKRSRSPTPDTDAVGGNGNRAVATRTVTVEDPLAKPGSIRVSKTLEEFDELMQPLPNRPSIVGKQGVAPKKKRNAFSVDEDSAILQGVARFPAVPGRFSQIFSAYREVWAPGRTPQHLFDHWRAALRDRAVNQ